ncbi:class F sortase [Terribacillus saccharophilus]|uniref:class F sortase n=1 Tax=Terribacillus saccharophilus TaxID=361277 RepID=UPI000571CEFA|nr:class F sortase [Terribacillus goriensis]
MRLTILYLITGVLVIGFFLLEMNPFQRQAAPPPTTETKTEQTSTENEFSAKKVAEFPLLEKQSQKLDQIREERKKQMEGIVPDRIEIPAIDVDATVQPKGELENGEMEVPADDHITGWYEPGYKPGSAGSSVIAGHVDSKKGPAVFFYLTDLEEGDEVYITDKDGKKLTFVVKEMHAYPAENAPIRQIFGASDKAVLNLITCTGTFDHERQTHPDRLVVTTELKQDKPKLPQAPTEVKKSTNALSWHAVRDEDIVGYRIYKLDGEKRELVTSVAAFERKNISIDNQDATYAVTAVDMDEQESEMNEMK